MTVTHFELSLTWKFSLEFVFTKSQVPFMLPKHILKYKKTPDSLKENCIKIKLSWQTYKIN